MATLSTTPPAASSAFDMPSRADKMALIFQEVFTVIVRLRANRQRVSDTAVFRTQIRNALKSAATEATRRGYVIEDVRLAVFAAVAFLDESILNSHNPILADWQSKLMQKDVFGVNGAAEIFFKNLEGLLASDDSEAVADVLELYQLCLLLGFRGRYDADGHTPEIQAFLTRIEAKISRIRGVAAAPLPWQPPAPALPSGGARWIRKLRWAAVACVALALILFIGYKISLDSSVGQLTSAASEIGK